MAMVMGESIYHRRVCRACRRSVRQIYVCKRKVIVVAAVERNNNTGARFMLK